LRLLVPALALAAALGACSREEPAPPKEAAAPDRPARPSGPTKTLKLAAEGASAEQLQKTVSILNERLRLAGIAGEAQLAGGSRILVTLPDDAAVLERAANLLLSGGELLFYALVTEQQMKPEEIRKHIEEIHTAKEAGVYDRAKAPYDAVVWKDRDEPALVENPGVPGYLLRQVGATKDREGKPAIEFVMTEAGSAEFHAFTGRHVGRLEAIVFDGKLILAPRILEPIEGAGIITGTFTEQEVADMVTILKSGKLPVELNLEAE
jgi:preprotein translocase subunit SecD